MSPQLRRLVLDLGPLLIFFGAFKYAGFFAATGAFMVAITAALAIGYAFERLVFGSIERATVQRWGMVRMAKG